MNACCPGLKARYCLACMSLQAGMSETQCTLCGYFIAALARVPMPAAASFAAVLQALSNTQISTLVTAHKNL